VIWAPPIPMLWLAASAVASAPATLTNENPPPPVRRADCVGSAEAAKERAEGKVRVRVLVTTEGTVAKVYVVDSSGNDALDDSAIACAEKWHFKPASWKGKAVAAWTQMVVTFQFNSGRPPRSPEPNPVNP
jgi:periplasmic protein TonB